MDVRQTPHLKPLFFMKVLQILALRFGRRKAPTRGGTARRWDLRTEPLSATLLLLFAATFGHPGQSRQTAMHGIAGLRPLCRGIPCFAVAQLAGLESRYPRQAANY
jgi:hypothetical protein